MFSRLMERFQRFMVGRHGPDQLNLALVAVWFLISLLLAFIPRSLWFLRLIPDAILILCLYRIFSKNLVQRQLENDRFLKWWYHAIPNLQKKLQKLRDRKDYRFFRCPGCGRTLRLPKGRGKIRINCPICGHSFERKT